MRLLRDSFVIGVLVTASVLPGDFHGLGKSNENTPSSLLVCIASHYEGYSLNPNLHNLNQTITWQFTEVISPPRLKLNYKSGGKREF